MFSTNKFVCDLHIPFKFPVSDKPGMFVVFLWVCFFSIILWFVLYHFFDKDRVFSNGNVLGIKSGSGLLLNFITHLKALHFRLWAPFSNISLILGKTERAS